MTSFLRFSALTLMGTILAIPALAELPESQRLADFHNIVTLYSKRYAPFAWKEQALGVDMFNLTPWEARIKNAKSDLEFLEVMFEYVANLQDTHSSFSLSSTFSANLGFTVDVFDDKVLIDGISRTSLPALTYPFQIGDEVVSVDGKRVEDWIALFSKYRKYGSPGTTRRVAAGQITVRAQNVYPRAHEIGDTAAVLIRRANGNEESYDIPWIKSGLPKTDFTPGRFATEMRDAFADAAARGDYQGAISELQTWALPHSDLAFTSVPGLEDPDGNQRSFVLGVGSRNPVFRLGLPSNFVVRRGQFSSDIHFSGYFQSGGKTIGFLRIPSFAPSSTAQAIAELNSDIAFFQQNTDALIVDVMRNPGGGCLMLDVAARLIPNPFYFFGEQLIVTQDRIASMQSLRDALGSIRADQWILDTYDVYLAAMKTAYAQSGTLTGPIPACSQNGSLWAPLQFGNPAAATVYTKPLVTLIDEFSISAADIFPAMLQDNQRGILVGMRTSGGGGSVSSWNTGFYSETGVTNTNSLVVRRNPVATVEYPAAPYIENLGTRPDVILNYMTRENLLNDGRPFFNSVTQIVLDEIRKAAGGSSDPQPE